jgi:hypothetical protein
MLGGIVEETTRNHGALAEPRQQVQSKVRTSPPPQRYTQSTHLGQLHQGGTMARLALRAPPVHAVHLHGVLAVLKVHEARLRVILTPK